MKKRKKSILVVDDEKNTREGLVRLLHRAYEVQAAGSGAEALRMLGEHPVDVLLSDIRMPGMDGVTLMQRALAAYPDMVVILLTAYGSIDTAVEAVKRGASDYLTKPVNLDDLEHRIRRAIRSREVEAENRNLHEQLDARYGLDQIIGESEPMQRIYEITRQVAPTRATVLIQGESGTGKELIAHALHRLSTRAQGPFIAVHCAALSSSLLESELFGHERGAFTGAVERRRGRFEIADGGTLFLDEIGEIDASVQVKILRVLEERRFERVGGHSPIDVDVRLVAATNKDLKKEVEEKRFRDDLYYRLNVVPVTIPPLRERSGDIPILLHHFLREFSEQNGRAVAGVTPDAMDILQQYDWPGNVRELRNLSEHMVVLHRGGKITVGDIPPVIREQVRPGGVGKRKITGQTLQDAERQLIESALREHAGNRTEAARKLGISRRTLHRKLNTYGLREPTYET